jgi:FkbM family methyltransferase
MMKIMASLFCREETKKSNEARLSEICDRLSGIERMQYGAKAVYVGNGTLLTKANFHGLIYLVEADDRLIVPRFVMDGVFEPEVTNYFLSAIKEESICIDIGANFGYYTCLMAKMATRGRVISIEPDQGVFNLLRDNVYINWLEGNVELHNAAVSDAAGTLRLYRRDKRSGNTSIINLSDDSLAAMGERPSIPFEVSALTLDSLMDRLSRPPDLLKIDVEGAEPLVFRGARKLLASSDNICIVMEWSPGQIRAAGFDPVEFLRDLKNMRLRPNILSYSGGPPDETTWEFVSSLSLANLLLTSIGS